MNRSLLVVPALIAAATVGALGNRLLSNAASDGDAAAVREPRYWVAPMDPSYRRDAPGKSPMGMDLVPVYEEGAGDNPTDDPAGTVRIESAVVNNLGVRSAPAERRTLRPTLRTVGYVRWDEDRLTHVHPRVSGWIETLHVKAAGDPVFADEPLYTLYSPDLVNAQEELVLALRHDNATLARAARERLAALQVPMSLVRALEEDLRVRQTVTFTARHDGIVDELGIREGFYVEPGTTLMAIGALDSVWVEAEVLERQLDRVRVGMPVRMTADYRPGRVWTGRVDFIYPSLDPVSRTLRLRLRFANPDGALRPNMFTRVVLEAEPGEPVLAVPGEAVVRTGAGDRVVLALGDGRFRAVAVELGAHDDRFVEVRAGLGAGDRVVTSAQFLLDSESSQRAGLARLSVDNGAMGRDAMNHDAMDHEAMDHDAMDHDAMDHDAMDHSAMKHNSEGEGAR
ncbi:efflux RND transporter periplasmic adaptor subunit [Pseudohaliea rubra]|uniref:Cobalt/zinc/cadmium efflux RND transporter, membrane fusion protein, CzcB family n=1 Tax=Pseudohaliea rubra DSM 19751 TaxID=1265313 RepID=A0A095VNB9_9GAMM|nr:efflux RND transporter periplasmic adaptor subunit [Pseudohaliea rubra]KGE02972.1 Cobalt/zinc/cadmium efflux RND transporter, membrane fusion protein, CzcB family [Pseudohaliea rubra DSM 19751]